MCFEWPEEDGKVVAYCGQSADGGQGAVSKVMVSTRVPLSDTPPGCKDDPVGFLRSMEELAISMRIYCKEIRQIMHNGALETSLSTYHLGRFKNGRAVQWRAGEAWCAPTADSDAATAEYKDYVKESGDHDRWGRT